LNLISTANVISKKRKSEKIEVADVKRAYEYFLDLTRSQEWLKGQAGKLIFEEGQQQSDDKMDQS
jgi:RuvB-like protein 2